MYRMAATLVRHRTLYLIEAWGLGTFMLVACLAATLLEARGVALPGLMAGLLGRRFLMGMAMGLTAIALIYSPWGARSGAHFNPAITLTFAALGKIHAFDAALYVCAQCVGGLCGVLLAYAIAGDALARVPVSFIATFPGPRGTAVAFGMEALISALLMALTLITSNRARLMRYTGVFCGLLIVLFVTFEAPYSGMSMNPARTLASALPSGIWSDAWVYFTAPLLGMALAAAGYRLVSKRTVACAKLNHDTEHVCPFYCQYRTRGIHVPSLARGLLPLASSSAWQL